MDAFQVRKTNFNWQIAETDNFKVYYYPDREDKFEISHLLEKLEYTHTHVSLKLNTVFDRKTPVFIYHTHNDFKQNRIAPVGEGTEGFSELYKSRLVIPNRNSNYDMEHLMAHEYTHIAQFELLYGGFWRSAKLIKGLTGLVPLWIMEGQAEHVSHEILDRNWSAYDKMVLRDAVLYDNLYNFRELHNFNAIYKDVYLGYKQGHSAIDYLVEEEGPEINFKLLRSFRNNIDPMVAFEEAVESFASLRDFNLKWQDDLETRVKEFVKGKEKGEDIYTTRLNEGKYAVLNPVSSGRGLYYVSDKWGPYEIYKYKPEGEKKRVIKNFFGSEVDSLVTGRRYDRIIDYNSNSNILTFCANKNNRSYLYLYRPGNNSIEKIDFKNLSELRSPSLNEQGDKIVFSGFKNFKRDIYVYNINTRQLKQITNDKYIDYGPVFKNSDREILVSTERNYSTDLREIYLENGVSKWITDTPANEIHPIEGPEDKIYFSSDKNDVFNIYEYDSSKSLKTALSNVTGGLFYPNLFNSNTIIFSSYFDGSYKIQISSFPENEILPELKRRHYGSLEAKGDFELENARFSDPEFNFSTDLFLPSFLYSTEIGFLGGGYYRGSDILGHHTLDFYGWAWTDVYEISGQYILKKWRPDIFVSGIFDRQTYALKNEDGETEIESDRRNRGTVGYSYPLSSNLRVSNWVRVIDRNIQNDTTGEKILNYTDTGLGAGIIRNTVFLEPFTAFRGSITEFSVFTSPRLLKNDLRYNTYMANIRKYYPLSHRLVLASRFNYSRRTGPDGGDFRLAGTGTELRGYAKESFRGKNRSSVSAELRYMLFPDLNWHFYFMWPDINIYSLSVKAFTDAGSCWNDSFFPSSPDEWGNSFGLGIKLNLFLLQQAPIYINVDYARPYSGGSWKTYVTFSSGHVTW